MALTVPRGGVIAGASTTVQVAKPETANIIAEFGNRMQQHGMAWADKQRQRVVQKQQLDMTRDYGLARLEAERLTDPAEIGAFWDAKNAELDEKYVTSQTDPEIASALGIARQETADRHTIGLAGRQVELERSQQEADWIEASQLIVTEAVTADPDTLAMLIEQGEARIDSSELDPAEKAKRKQALRETVFTTRAKAMVDRDPAGFLAAVEAGEYSELGEKREDLTVAAENALARQAAKAEKDAELATKEARTSVGKRFDAISSLAGDGFSVVDEEYLNNPELVALAAGDPDIEIKRQEALAAVNLRNKLPGLKQMTIEEWDQWLAAAKARKLKEPFEANEIKAGQKYRDKAAADRASDAVKALTGVVDVPVLPEFSADTATDWAVALGLRIGFDIGVREQGLAGTQAILSKAEIAQLDKVADPKGDLGASTALVDAIVSGSDGNPAAVLAAMGADSSFRQAVTLYARTGDVGLRDSILRGRQKIATGTIPMPSETDISSVFHDLTGNHFASGSPEERAIMEATTAIYADTALDIDKDARSGSDWRGDRNARDMMERAILRATGAAPDDRGNLTIGGLQEINGYKVVLPVGVPQAGVERMWDNIEEQLDGYELDRSLAGGRGGWVRKTYEDGKSPDPLRAFAAGSLYGGKPALGDNPAGMLDYLQMRVVDENLGIYRLVTVIDGIEREVGQEDGTEYFFRLSDLMQGAKQ